MNQNLPAAALNIHTYCRNFPMGARMKEGMNASMENAPYGSRGRENLVDGPSSTSQVQVVQPRVWPGVKRAINVTSLQAGGDTGPCCGQCLA
jgi:hypothetical protein